jgi:ribose 5-phosphate isomerase B
VGLGPFDGEVRGVLDDLVLEEVGDDDVERVGCPHLGTDERTAQLDRVEERRTDAASTEFQHAQLARSVGSFQREARIAGEVDAELWERGAPPEIDSPAGPVAEDGAVPLNRSAIQMDLLGLELAGLDEGSRLEVVDVAVGQLGVFDEAIRNCEASVRGLVGPPLGAAVFLREPPPAHRLRPPQHRRRNPRRFVDLHVRHRNRRVRHHRGTDASMCNRPRGRGVSTLVGMRIAIGADHAGYPLKQYLVGVLKEWGHDVDDLGTHSEEPVDYPPICARVGRAVVAGSVDMGIVLGGSGQGEQISANKVRGVRAALCNDLYTARLAREHNNANVLSMGARILAPALAEEITRMFLETAFAGGRHARRIEEIATIEAEEAR